MHAAGRAIAAQFPPDGKINALMNAMEQGYCAGYRLSEFAQHAGRTDPMNPALNHLVSATMRTRALVPNDFRIYTDGYRRAVGLNILNYLLLEIERMLAQFRTQKNGSHGEEKLFCRNPNLEGFCYVTSVYHSLERFKRLQVLDPRLDPAVTPLTVYWDDQTETVKLLDSKDIATFMQRLACSVYHLNPVADAAEVRKWGVHSLRVGACVTLHAMGFSVLDIQWLLRWRSTAFMVYLRNIACLAVRHYEALDKAAALPFL
jgi:hypothetical protein